MEVGAGAARNQEPARDIEIILSEHAGSFIRVREAGNVAGPVGLALRRSAHYPDVAAKGAPDSHFPEKHFVPVAFADLAEAVIVVLRGSCDPGGDDIAALDKELEAAPEVVTACVQRFHVRGAGSCQCGSGHRATLTVLVSNTTGEE